MSRRWASVSSPVARVADLAAPALLRRAQASDDLDRCRPAARSATVPNGTKPRSTRRIRPSSSSSGVTTMSPARPPWLRLTTTIASSGRYSPVATTGRHSRSSTSAVGRDVVSGIGGWSMRASTVALKAWRSSSRRSCQNPRLTISTTAPIAGQVEQQPPGTQQEAVHGWIGRYRCRGYRRRSWSCRTSTSRTPRRSSG